MIDTKRIAAMACALAILASAGSAAAQQVPSFLQDGKLQICTAGDFPPMEFYQNPGDAEMVGYEIDLVHAFANLWNVTPEFILGDFSGLLPSLEAQRCDMVVSGINLTPKRLETYDGIAHFNTSVVMVVAASDTTTKSPEDLAGKVLAIEGGTTYEEMAKTLNDTLAAAGKAPVEVQTYTGAAPVFQQILIGRAVATITQDTTAAFRQTQMPDKFAITYTFPDIMTYGIYIRKNADDLTALKQGFAAIKDSGELAKIVTKWNLPASVIDVKN